jgi:hypothetical protein
MPVQYLDNKPHPGTLASPGHSKSAALLLISGGRASKAHSNAEHWNEGKRILYQCSSLAYRRHRRYRRIFPGRSVPAGGYL